MKKVTKLKTVQPPKGNLKISNFFHKKVTSHVNGSVSVHVAQPSRISESHDCDIGEFNDIITCGNCNESNNIIPGCVCKTVECNTVQDTSSKLRYSDDSTQDTDKKRKFCSPDGRNGSSSKRRNSVCENAQSSSDSIHKAIITVKTPDKLFPQTNIEYNLSRTEVNADQCVKSPLKNCDTNISRSQFKKTPSKTPKKSPKPKLFDKSPEKLEEFNVQIINNFIKITPSKSSNKIVNNIKLPGSDSKRQTSMLQYMSPGSSGSKKAQKFNETTPKKEDHSKTIMVSPSTSRAKLKLDFSSCVKTGSKDEEANMCNDLMFANLGNEFQDDWDITFSAAPEDLKLDLLEPKHCKVIESIEMRNRITIKIESTNSTEKAICYLEGFWISVRLKPNDIVYLRAAKNVEGNWIINNEHGLLVYEPDLLISSTSIAQSVFCMRRKVLSEKYPGFEPTNRVMVIGIFVHNLLQTVLKRNIQTTSGVSDIIEQLVSSQDAIRRMYEASLSLSDVRTELSHFIPKIVDFVKHYVLDVPQQSDKSLRNAQILQWNGKIDSVDDIEENIWCPQLGIKGKVDVSVRSKNKVYPLELKTGRASMSLEHRGQVILYVMMMNTLGHEISSGLLHYLKEGLLTEINITHKESRDIMILRNELAYFLSRTPNISNEENSKCDTVEPHVFELPELPAPIDLSHSCKQCGYNVICSSYVPYEHHDNSHRQNFLKMQRECVLHLQKPHLDYFIWWTLLLSLENMAHKDGKPVRQIYTESPNKRAEKGKCINNVKILKVEEKTDCMFEHTFGRDGIDFVNFLASGIEENNYVVVSTDDRPAVSTGFVMSISISSITINLDRNLTKKFGNSLFHLDTYDSECSSGFNMACLALLIEDSPGAERLRKIIIDKEAPTFLSKLPKIVAVKALPILKRLNKSQQKAVLRSLAAKDYLLIKGMPGTGKTATIVALVQLLVAVDKTVLITSHTHSAIDNVCVRLQKFGIDVLRLGSVSKINEQVKLNSEYTQTKHCKSPEEIEAVYNKASVIAVTCLGSGHPLVSRRTVDVCLVDESTQVIQPSVFRALYYAKTFILIGDPEQLEPTVKNREAVKRGMTETLFERLQSPDACVVLDQNYRMNKTITGLANLLTYNGELLIGNEAVANAHLHIPNEEGFRNTYKDQQWVLDVLNTSLEYAVQFVDTNLENFETNFDETKDKSYVNMYEAAIVTKLITVLLESGVSRHDIGVIATYRDQVAYLSRQLGDVDVSTVDQFQGRDKKVILYSCTKYRSKQDGSFSQFHLLENHRRLTVAVTRAKHKLIIIGEMNAIKQHKPFGKMLNALDKSKFIKLENGKCGFNWNALLK